MEKEEWKFEGLLIIIFNELLFLSISIIIKTIKRKGKKKSQPHQSGRDFFINLYKQVL